MYVRQDMRGDEQVKAYIKTIPHGVTRVGIYAIAEYILGDQTHGLKHYPPYRYITRKKAYGKTFSSDKQRRFVMAAIREGRIDPGVPHRTGNTQRAWRLIKSNPYRPKIVAKGAGPYYTADDQGQARLNAMIGWRKMAKNIADNMVGALRHANAEIRKWLKG